jgi:hypothetical protein
VALRQRHPRQQRAVLKETLHDIDLLVIDDMQFLQGKKIQSEFCHLINMLLDSARQVVVAADRPPHELESLDPRVRSRCRAAWRWRSAPGLRDAAGNAAQAAGDCQIEDDLTLDIDEVLAHVAQNITSSFRELEGAFNQLLFRRSFEPNLRSSGSTTFSAISSMRRRAQAGSHRGHPAGGFAALQCLAAGHAVEPAHAGDRQAAADRDVSGQDDDAALASRNRPQIRRTRPHHGAACGAQDGRADQPDTDSSATRSNCSNG